MCNSCKTLHEKITTLTGHSLIKYEEVNSFPTTSLMQAIKCHHHNGENREFYCSDHCTSFCFTCFLQDHRRCEHSERIEKVANDLNQSVRIEEIINRIEKQQKSLETIHDHKHSTLQALNEERPKLEAEMSALIEKINSHVLSVIDETGNLLNTEIKALEEDMQEIKKDIEKLERQKSDINLVSNVCSHSKTFLFLHETENILSKNEEKFDKMKSDCNLVKLIVSVSDNMGTLLKNITNVSIDRTSAKIPSSSNAMIPTEVR
ncbi:unnamed protein product [Mytilus coruscus]|uniref:B box-type domain-containing protein n=1 Tax=Mytilus coruscus TaxID=42192 RepID=A0A6J8A0N5_MYTCO|nr:unnamed protein product [Mytilus coruscus]